MIKLHQYYAHWDLPNPSPFCMKVETYLRLAELPFEIVVTPDPRKAPKRKLPYIIDEKGVMVADSAFIIRHLQKRDDVSLDNELTKVQKAKGHLVCKTLEESFYWVMLHTRWIDDAGWAVIEPVFFGRLPPIIKNIVPGILRNNVRKAAEGHGYGRHSPAELLAIGKADLDAVSAILGDEEFLLGDKPSSYDATVHAFVGGLLWVPIDCELQRYAKSIDNLVAYCDRIKANYFSK